MIQWSASPVAAAQRKLLAVVLKEVQFMRREAVLVARIEHDHFLGIERDMLPNEEQVV
jgi:hypothetical protein